MLKNSSHSRNLSAKVRSPRWRGLLLMLLLTIGFASAGRVQAAPDMAWTRYWFRVSPRGTITLCEGEKQVFHLWVIKSVWGWGGGVAGQTVESYVAGRLVSAIAGDSQIGSITPVNQVTPGAASGIGTGGVQFVFSAKQSGTTEVTFADLAPGSPIADETVTVEVRRCKYRVVTFSTWTIPDGFRPRMFSVLGADVEPDRSGHFDPVIAQVQNYARGLTPFACPVTMQAPDTEAKITGRMDTSSGILYLEVDYDPVPATVRVICPDASGMSPIDEGEPRVLIPQGLSFSGSAGGFYGTLPHILEAYMIVSGRTTLIVVPEPLP